MSAQDCCRDSPCRRSDWSCRVLGLVEAARASRAAIRHDLLQRRRPEIEPVACKPESEIIAAIGQVHAKYDYFEGDDLKAFEQRAALLKGLPPLNIEKLYVITEDDQLRDGEMVLFIGLRVNCVTTVFGLPTKLYRELSGMPEPARRLASSGPTQPESVTGLDAESARFALVWRYQCRRQSRQTSIIRHCQRVNSSTRWATFTAGSICWKASLSLIERDAGGQAMRGEAHTRLSWRLCGSRPG